VFLKREGEKLDLICRREILLLGRCDEHEGHVSPGGQSRLLPKVSVQGGRNLVSLQCPMWGDERLAYGDENGGKSSIPFHGRCEDLTKRHRLWKQFPSGGDAD
jgi:hypothetical protein